MDVGKGRQKVGDWEKMESCKGSQVEEKTVHQ